MTWRGIDAPKAVQIGSEFPDDQAQGLVDTLSTATILSNREATTVWAVRVTATGNLEFLATQSTRLYRVVATLTPAGVWSTAGAQNPAVGLADPGR